MSADNFSVDEWMHFAKMDYAGALSLAQSGCFPELVCFHAQQFAEKVLKAYIDAKGGTVAKTHDLEYLLEQCKRYSPDFDVCAESCYFLTTYNTVSRYPPKSDLGERHIKQALNCASQILEFMKPKLRDFGYEFSMEDFDVGH